MDNGGEKKTNIFGHPKTTNGRLYLHRMKRSAFAGERGFEKQCSSFFRLWECEYVWCGEIFLYYVVKAVFFSFLFFFMYCSSSGSSRGYYIFIVDPEKSNRVAINVRLCEAVYRVSVIVHRLRSSRGRAKRHVRLIWNTVWDEVGTRYWWNINIAPD